MSSRRRKGQKFMAMRTPGNAPLSQAAEGSTEAYRWWTGWGKILPYREVCDTLAVASAFSLILVSLFSDWSSLMTIIKRGREQGGAPDRSLARCQPRPAGQERRAGRACAFVVTYTVSSKSSMHDRAWRARGSISFCQIDFLLLPRITAALHTEPFASLRLYNSKRL